MIHKQILLLILLFLINVFGKQPELKIKVFPGEHYTHSVFGIQIVPQLALWIEDTTGKFLATIYVSKYSAYTFGKKSVKRPDALPIWRCKGFGLVNGNSSADAVSSASADATTAATPKSQFDKIWAVPDSLKVKKLFIYAEINNSFDYNETYKKKLHKKDKFFNGVNGQPSLLYRGTLDISKVSSVQSLELLGHGNLQGHDGNADADLAHITTAKTIVDSITIETTF